jgi:hypothetical protein
LLSWSFWQDKNTRVNKNISLWSWKLCNLDDLQ